MTKRKVLDLKFLEKADRIAHAKKLDAQEELEAVRRLISRKKREPLTPLEYALQWEDLAQATLAAKKIEQLLAPLARMSFLLVEVPGKEDVSRYTAGTVCESAGGITLRTSGASIHFIRSVSWSVIHKPNKKENPLLSPYTLRGGVQENSVLEMTRCPLHRCLPLTHTETFDYFVKNEESRKAFESLHHLFRGLGWQIAHEDYAVLLAEAKQKTADDCVRQARDLMGIIDEGFVHGARSVTRHHTTEANNDSLSRRMIELRERMADTLRRCEMYGVDNEHRVKIELFFKHFLNGFSIIDVPVR